VIIIDTIGRITFPIRAPRSRNREARLTHLLGVASAPARIDSRIGNHQNYRAQEATGYDDGEIPPADNVQRRVFRSEDLRCGDTAEVGWAMRRARSWEFRALRASQATLMGSGMRSVFDSFQGCFESDSRYHTAVAIPIIRRAYLVLAAASEGRSLKVS
jgi:hypothetical protein